MYRFFALTASALLLLTLFGSAPGAAQPDLAYTPETQAAELFYDEAMTVYLGNLERRKAGLPPLRWNRELSLAARWFAWDSVENRPVTFCGHEDTLGGWPADRVVRFAYPPSGIGENAYCGYNLTPAGAIQAWMNSPGHRDNLLHPDWREIGLGDYYRASDGREYMVQDFSYDEAYHPLVISNEAPSSSSGAVSLYIYSPQGTASLGKLGAAREMLVSNDACFSGASWQPYQAEIPWNLSAGDGWKNVYVKIRDAWGRTAAATDSIYRGASLPIAELSLNQLSQIQDSVTLNNLTPGGMPYAQFSLSWMADNSIFTPLWGSVTTVNDSQAAGGTALEMTGSSGESSAWYYTTTFPTGAPMVAYFRLKTSSSSSSGSVARVQVEANGTLVEYTITGKQFQAANQYQEFAIPFTFQNNPAEPFLIFQIWATSSAVIHADGVTVFTASQPVSGSSTTWDVPGSGYRGQGVWVRYADDSGNFTSYQEALVFPPGALSARPSSLVLLSETGVDSDSTSLLICSQPGWSVHSQSSWLQTSASGSTLKVWGNASLGDYPGEVVLQSASADQLLRIPVRLLVVPQVHRTRLPYIGR